MKQIDRIFTVKQKSKPVSGLLVNVHDTDSDLIFTTATDIDGYFRVYLKSESDPSTIHFLDADNNTVQKENWGRKSNLTIRKDREIKLRSIRHRQQGNLLNKFYLDKIKRLILKHTSDSKLISFYDNILKMLTPELQNVGDIMGISAGVLDGDLNAVNRFRQYLDNVKPIVFAGREDASKYSRNVYNSSFRSHCMFTRPSYEQLIIATSIVSRDTSEFRKFSKSLELGLAGIRSLERIVNASFHTKDQSELESEQIVIEQLNRAGFELGGYTPYPEPEITYPPDFGPGYPPIEDFIPELDLCEIFRQECIPGITESFEGTFREDNDGDYRIDNITVTEQIIEWGQTLKIATITGINFGPNVSAVIFPKCGGGTVLAIPTTQSQTEVIVAVPDDVTSGIVSLKIPLGMITSCDSVIPVYENGIGKYYDSLYPSLGFLKVNGDDHACVSPHDSILVEWYACPLNATVELKYGAGAWVPVTNIGQQTYNAPVTSSEYDITVSLRVSTSEETKIFSRIIHVTGVAPSILIYDVEFTQGIQRMFHTDGYSDNSVPLVQDKDTIARVYVDVDRGGFNSDEIYVTGEINIINSPIRSSASGIRPLNPGTFSPFSQSDRNETNGTLNFLIPADVCQGALDLSITIVGDYSCEPPPSHSRIENISFLNIPALPVRIRRIEGSSGNSPTVTEAMRNVINAFTYLPSSDSNVSMIGGVHEVSWRVRGAGGYDNNTGLWLLSQDISAEHGSSQIWVGLTAKENRGIMAWPDNFTCISHAEEDTEGVFSKTAHEIGHCLGLGHVQNTDEICAPVGCEDDWYEGEQDDVPFPVRRNEVIVPSWDLMSYSIADSRFLHPNLWIQAMTSISNTW